MNRQESHRIYLQLFAPRSASPPRARGVTDGSTLLHRHGSHDIHPPTYPTLSPGAPYQFTSSSDESQSSYSFSSLSTLTGGGAGSSATAQHRPPPQKNRFVGYPSTVITSAAVRLTDKARAKDVTSLLRGKFGLPSAQQPNQRSSEGAARYPSSRFFDDSHRAHDANSDDEVEVDALVIVGTIERPPRGYLRFEHEEFQEERERVELFRSRQRQQKDEAAGRERGKSEETVITANHNNALPVSESTATVKASGAQSGWTSSALLASSASMDAMGGSEPNLSTLAGLGGSAIGLDLSSSRGTTSTWGVNQWGSLRGAGSLREDAEMDFSSSRFNALVSEQSAGPVSPDSRASLRSQQPVRSPGPYDDHDLEPIHLVRTVLPDEHPLQVRDEMMALLNRSRRKAELEMGLFVGEEEGAHASRPQPTIRFYFQPCSALGGIGTSENSPKIQSIPAYVDVEGYCTEEESESDADSNADEDDNGGGASRIGFDDVVTPAISSQMRQLIEERRRIGVLKELKDPSSLVSGYLLKQSRRDPNVWRRVYCVLSDDRMWTIERMKPLSKTESDSTSITGDELLSSLRIGRHKYFKLHRSLLLERGEGTQSTRQRSSSRYNGYNLTPLSNRLPNAFRVLTSQGKCHTFRAFNSQSFRVWVASLSEKIAQKHLDGMIELAGVITEEETLARCRRLDEVAVSPLESLALRSMSMDIVRFGIAVSSFRELCRHVDDAIFQYRNRHGAVVNVQTRVGSRMTRTPSSPTSVESQLPKNSVHIGMVNAAWEDARIVASKSAQLLHVLAAVEHDKLSKEEGDSEMKMSPADPARMKKLIEEQKGVQEILGKHWNHLNNVGGTAGEDLSSPPAHLFDRLLEMLQKSQLGC